MTDEIKIRVATAEDLDEIMVIAMAACEENGFLNPNPQKLAAEIWPALHQDHGICGVIGKPGGPIEGGVLLRIGTMWYSYAQESDLHSSRISQCERRSSEKAVRVQQEGL